MFALGTLAATLTQAQTFTGNELLEKLRVQDPSAVHYVAGVVEATAASKAFFEINPAGLQPDEVKAGLQGLARLWGCRPEKATYGQVADVLVAYLSNRPKVRHLDATLLLAFAIKDAWPCAPK
jgi:hypothetical protein